MDAVFLGELLIDFTPAGFSKQRNPLFERNAGGGVANAAAAFARLGGRCAFTGKVGSDQFGLYLRDAMASFGVDTTGLALTDKASTTLAFVHLFENGDRTFSFCRKPGADTLLREDELDLELICSAPVFHISSLSLTDEPARTATFRAVEAAKRAGAKIAYDPNWRPPLWRDEESAKRWMYEALKLADLVKMSEEELLLLTGSGDPEEGSSRLMEMGVTLAAVTLGENGCCFRRGADRGWLPAYDIKAIDTTGAGDAFWGAALYRLTRPGLDYTSVSAGELADIFDFANAAGGYCARGLGAMPSMGTQGEIENLRANTPRKNAL